LPSNSWPRREKRSDLTNHGVHWRASFHHHHRDPRFFQRGDKFFQRAGGLNVFSLRASGSEFIGHFSGAIKHGDGKAFRFQIEGEVFAHHTEADEAKVTLICVHFSISFPQIVDNVILSEAKNL